MQGFRIQDSGFSFFIAAIYLFVALVQLWLIREQRGDRRRWLSELAVLLRRLHGNGVRLVRDESGNRVAAFVPTGRDSKPAVEKLPANQWFRGKARIVSVEPVQKA